MIRGVRLTLALTALLAVAGQARAQFGYGYYPGGYGGYGWGGWGGTVQGDIARGLGYYAMGAGAFNRQTAIANAINADTLLRWNQYWYEAQVTANRNERLRMDERLHRDTKAGELAHQRILDDPTAEDIASGNALNGALEQLDDPKVHSSVLRLAKDKIPGKVIRDIPFVNASEAVTINLNRLTGKEAWPRALKAARFDEPRNAYASALKKAMDEDRDGEISDDTLQQLHNALVQLHASFKASPPPDAESRNEGLNYLKTLFGMNRMLAKPEITKIIAELDSIKETTLGSLLGFMQTFNLRFGRAETPSQRAAYEQLYPLLDAHRDRVVASVRRAEEAAEDRAKSKSEGESRSRPTADETPRPANYPIDFFQGMHLDHLEGTPEK